MSFKITLKHGKTKHKNVEFDPSEGFEVLQAQVFAITNVPVERQKIIFKGKTIDSDEQLSKLKKKSILTVMGSAEAAAAAPTEKMVFMEDMTQAERAELSVSLPPGLNNLQNTCYLNATLQAVRALPELEEPIKAHGASATEPSVSASLGKLFTQMGKSEEPVTPMEFVNVFRQRFPVFNERSPKTGGFMQHDADEAYMQIIQSIKAEVKTDGSNPVTMQMTGEYEVKRKCAEPGCDEKEEVMTESFEKLQCFIGKETNHVIFGVQEALTEQIERRSPTLDRNALYDVTRRVKKLPNVLAIQFVRFFWKNKVQKKAKIMRKIVFPEKMDVREWCTDEVRQQIGAYRRAKLEYEDRMREKRQTVEISSPKAGDKKKSDAAAEPKKGDAAAEPKQEDASMQDADEEELARAMAMSMETDGADQKENDKTTTDAMAVDAGNTDQVHPANAAAMEALQKELGVAKLVPCGAKVAVGDTVYRKGKPAKVLSIDNSMKPPSVTVRMQNDGSEVNTELTLLEEPAAKRQKTGDFITGDYELVSLVCHKGRSSDSGHYIGYATGADGNLIKFDDDTVVACDKEEAKRLYGGGDRQMAYIAFYRKVPPIEFKE